jgi:hypothetical protein
MSLVVLILSVVVSFEVLLAHWLTIDAQAQFFADFEERYFFLSDRNEVASSRIPSFSRRALFDDKTSKPADFDTFPLGKRVGHAVKDGIDHNFGVSSREPRILLRHFLN